MLLIAECPEINASQYHFVHHKYYRDWPELKLRSPIPCCDLCLSHD
jgi:hypothetical protein